MRHLKGGHEAVAHVIQKAPANGMLLLNALAQVLARPECLQGTLIAQAWQRLMSVCPCMPKYQKAMTACQQGRSDSRSPTWSARSL